MLKFGFYNSLNGDRTYSADDFSSIFNGIIKDGVFQSIGSALTVTANGGMNVLVGTGRAWFDNTWTDNDAPFQLTIPGSNAIFDRWDAIVLEVNHETNTRANSIKVKQGVASSSHAKPEMTRTELIQQYPIAYVDVKAGSTSIAGSNIENAVGTSECPFITGVLETLSVDFLISQWRSEFNENMNRWEGGFNTHMDDWDARVSKWLEDLKTIADIDSTGAKIVAQYAARLVSLEHSTPKITIKGSTAVITVTG